MLKKCFPALFQHAESGTGPDSASTNQALDVLDSRRAILGPRYQGVFQHPANGTRHRVPAGGHDQKPSIDYSDQRPNELIAQVTHVFYPHRQPDQAVADAEALAVGGRHRGVGHDGGVLDQAFDAAE